MKTRIMLGLTAATLLAACSSGRSASTAAPAPAVATSTPAPVVAAPAGTPLSVAAIPIGSPKFGATTDCNAMSGATAQGRTSATSMLDCAPLVVPVAAPPPPRPAAVPALQTFTTYFDFDRADITPAARNVAEQAAANARAGNATRILVVGHTDTSGSSRYNDRLSVQRAEAVRNALIAAGVPAGEIEPRGAGATDLAVQTPDGVREPRNRRVVIEPQRAGT
jgi:outer membrane protein OmpA-like peptidoglycan-associated protein